MEIANLRFMSSICCLQSTYDRTGCSCSVQLLHVPVVFSYCTGCSCSVQLSQYSLPSFS